MAEQEGKKWYASKTLWVNVVAILALLVEKLMGTNLLTTEAQAGILAVINIVLRIVTKEQVVWALLIGFFVFAMAVPSNAGEFRVCVWKDCPQGQIGTLKAGEEVDKYDVEILKSINLNGETNYVLRPKGDGGSGFGVGASTTIMSIKQVVDIDIKYVKMVNSDESNLVGLGTALDLPQLAGKIGVDWPFPKFVTAKFGVDFLTKYVSLADKPKGYLGFYAKIFQATF